MVLIDLQNAFKTFGNKHFITQNEAHRFFR